ncbi:phosphotransferase family protein [Yinghuangia soli]|uniref:Aminoglycoside phosphotransferase family protein n=1 Tax=Yinghuangia soli TaxID=2908204 RepID=A0AA41U024_9ACTN|nr:aminoglycoside phosphotransferase family protein [Yinghuangia soli]MCF2527925.1 aminoglycoside phosphotransferase family protein [Yinghuangia soli]
MHSITKPTVDQATLDALVTVVFGGAALPALCREATEGMYNTVFRLTLADGREVALKAAPAPDAPRLGYEYNILRTESLFFTRLAEVDGVPTPRVLSTGFERNLMPGDYLFMTALPGTPLDRLRADLSPDELAAVRRDLGGIVARMHAVHGIRFGYPQSESAPARWPDAFRGMVEAVLADAARLGADLTRPAAEILAAVEDNLGLLADVDSPVFVHFDLWDGNILVARDGGGARVGGVIDAERAFWGDPCADFVSLALFADIEADVDFLAGYREAGGTVEFTPEVRRRISLYRIYLYLIMLTEGAVRGYDKETATGLREWVGMLLAGELDALGDELSDEPGETDSQADSEADGDAADDVPVQAG